MIQIRSHVWNVLFLFINMNITLSCRNPAIVFFLLLILTNLFMKHCIFINPCINLLYKFFHWFVPRRFIIVIKKKKILIRLDYDWLPITPNNWTVIDYPSLSSVIFSEEANVRIITGLKCELLQISTVLSRPVFEVSSVLVLARKKCGKTVTWQPRKSMNMPNETHLALEPYAVRKGMVTELRRLPVT